MEDAMHIFLFVLLSLALSAILALPSFLWRGRLPLYADILLGVGEILLSFLVAIGLMAGPTAFIELHPFVVALYVALFALGAARLISLPFRRRGKGKRVGLLLPVLSLSLNAVCLSAGIVNAQLVLPSYHTLYSAKVSHEYRFAFLSDLHVGKAKSVEEGKNVLKKALGEGIDYLFLGGDMFDDYTSRQDMREILAYLRDSPVPIYWINGNHDPFGCYAEQELYAAIQDAGLIYINEDFVSLGEDLVLLGREDISLPTRKKESELINPKPEAFCLCIDHEPFAFKDNLCLGVDLQVSSHTHAGQLFPVRAIFDMAVPAYGFYQQEGKTLFVSSGAGNWAAPFRTEVGCRYEVFTLLPAVA